MKNFQNLRQTQSARHTEHYLSNLLLNIDTIKFAKEWNLRTGPSSGKFKAKFNETLFQRENDAIFRDLSPDKVRDKMQDIVLAHNRLSFAFDNGGTGILIDPLFSVHNLGDRRAKKFQSLLDMLIRLAPDSQHPETGYHTLLDNLEQSNRAVLYSLSASLCANEDEREVIAQYIDAFYIKYPSRMLWLPVAACQYALWQGVLLLSATNDTAHAPHKSRMAHIRGTIPPGF
ncbi:hypothetical protein B0H11DRAFT_2281808 [Mycena galericulata]|nr:hypothetical protein B0H11DRAFT_2281808 [Mycena galericulata]